MNGNGQLKLKEPVALVWSKLMDPNVLTECIVGCEKMELIDTNKYHAGLAIGIAAVKGKYDANIELADIDEPNGYKLIVHGEGTPGFVDAEGIIKLISEPDGGTVLTYDYTAAAGGKIAAVGQRMLGGVAKLIIGDFFKRLKKQIEKNSETA